MMQQWIKEAKAALHEPNVFIDTPWPSADLSAYRVAQDRLTKDQEIFNEK